MDTEIKLNRNGQYKNKCTGCGSLGGLMRSINGVETCYSCVLKERKQHLQEECKKFVDNMGKPQLYD